MNVRLGSLSAAFWTALGAALVLVACDPMPPVESVPEPVTLSVLSGQPPAEVEPLLSRIPGDASFRVRVEYGTSADLVAGLLAGGNETGADVVMVDRVGHLDALSARAILDTLPVDIYKAVDPRFRDRAGRWVGTSGELRVLAYRADALTIEELPMTLHGLSEAKWKGRIGWVPGDVGFRDHVSGLRHLWGDAKTGAWLRIVATHVPMGFADEAAVVHALHEGTIDLGWVGHSALHGLDGVEHTVAPWSFSAEHDAGNTMLLNGVGIVDGTPRMEAAQAFVEWLISEPTQSHFAQDVRRYPARAEILPHPLVAPLTDTQLTGHWPQNLIDAEATERLIRQVGLL